MEELEDDIETRKIILTDDGESTEILLNKDDYARIRKIIDSYKRDMEELRMIYSHQKERERGSRISSEKTAIKVQAKEK